MTDSYLDNIFSQWVQGMNIFFAEVESSLGKDSDHLEVNVLSSYVRKFTERADGLDHIHATHRRLLAELSEKEVCAKRGRGFDHLPPEIVGQILILASYPKDHPPSTATIIATSNATQHNPIAPLIFAQVNQKWRSVTLDTAALWSYAIHSNPHLLELYLERSKDCLIDLQIVVPAMSIAHEEGAYEPALQAMELRTRIVMELLIPHAGRWRSFSFKAVTTPLVQLALEMCKGLSVPNLESLALASTEIYEQPLPVPYPLPPRVPNRPYFPFPFQHGSIHKLHTMACRPIKVQLENQNIASRIQHLDVELHNEAWDMMHLLAPTLKSATLRVVGAVHRNRFPQERRRLELPSLTGLTIHLDSAFWNILYPLIDSLSAATLTSLTLKTDIDPYDVPNWTKDERPPNRNLFPKLTHLICDISPSIIRDPLRMQADTIREYDMFSGFFRRFDQTVVKVTIHNASALNFFIKQLQRDPEPGDGVELVAGHLCGLQELEVINCTGGGAMFLLKFIQSRNSESESWVASITKVTFERSFLRELDVLRGQIEEELEEFSYEESF